MNSRERVLMALHHEQPDRPPLVMGVSNATSLRMGAYRKLKQHLGIQAEDLFLYDWPMLGTARVDEETLQRLEVDVRGVWDCLPQSNREQIDLLQPRHRFYDSWGIGQDEVSPGEWIPTTNPLGGTITLDDVDRYSWPDMDDPTRVKGVNEAAVQLAQAGEYAVMGTPWLLFPLERAIQLRGMEAFLLDLAQEPDLALALLEKTTALCKRLMGRFLAEAGDALDLVKIGDDLGTQNSLLVSPGMYRRYIKPFHADYIGFIKAHTKAKVFFHSDGDIFPLLDDLAEIGVDVLNPIQASGKMANLEELKRRYGKELVFCGGIDTQHLLPEASPEQVAAEVRRVSGILGKGSGYLRAAVHTIMDNVPPENVLQLANSTLF
jgi:uroporphyrinogen decarboxylase